MSQEWGAMSPEAKLHYAREAELTRAKEKLAKHDNEVAYGGRSVFTQETQVTAGQTVRWISYLRHVTHVLN